MIIRVLALTLAVLALAGCVPRTDAPPVSTPSAVLSEKLRPKITQPPIVRPGRILFVGNSYFYYNDSLHNHVQRMVVASGALKRSDLTYKSATIGGAALRDHAIDHLLDPANLRVDEPFEVVVLQGLSSAALNDEGRERFRDAVRSHAAKIRNAGGHPILYMTPAYSQAHDRYRADMIDDVANLYVETANEIDVLVIPVGLAFAEAYRRRPEIVLHKQFDGSHPSLLGTYLAAATVLASVYGISPVGNSYDYFGAVGAEDAQFLQSVAHDTAMRFYGRNR